MFSKLFASLFLSCLTLSIFSQNPAFNCGFSPTVQQKQVLIANLQRTSIPTTALSTTACQTIPVYFWVNRSSVSARPSVNILKISVDKLNTAFNFSTQTKFVFSGVQYISDSRFFAINTGDNTQLTLLNDTYMKNNGNILNVFIPDNSNSLAPFFDPAWVIVYPDQLTNTLAPDPFAFPHEVGHIFGLIHTWGFSTDPNVPKTNLNTELKIRQFDGTKLYPTPNYNSTGDYDFSNADPYTQIVGQPDFSPCPVGVPCTKIDLNGDFYNPPYTNFMSYYRQVNSTFTPTQQTKMDINLADNSISQTGHFNGHNYLLNCSFPITFSNFGRIGRALGGGSECATGNDSYFSLPGAFVNLAGANGSYTTDANGYFLSQSGLALGNNYTVIPTKNDDNMAGVSTYDIILMSRHILGIQTFTSSYQMMAADVDNSGDIDAADMLTLRRFILQISPLNVGSWRFIPNYFFSQPSFTTQFNNLNPFGATSTGYNYLGDAGNSSFMDKIDYNPSVPDALKLGSWDFRPIKSGDVNGSYFSNCASFGSGGGGTATAISTTGGGTVSALSAKVANNTSTLSTAKTMTMKNTEAKTIVLKAKSGANIVSMQVGFRFLKNKMAISDVIQGDFNSSNDVFDFSNFAKGEMKALWFDKRGNVKNIKAGTVILKAKVKANADVDDILKALNLDDQILKNEFHDAKGNLVPMDLEWTDEDGTETEVEKPISATVYPNPFTNNLTFDVTSKVAGEATLTITNVITKQSQIVKQQMSVGLNTISLNNTNSLSAGALTYSIVIGSNIFNGTITKVK